MSTGTLQQVMTRIKGSTTASPIAVFRCGSPGELNAVFAATVRTQQLIAAGDSDLIGVYHGSMDMGRVERELSAEILLVA